MKLIQNKKIFYAWLIYFISIVLYIGIRILWGTGLFNNLDASINDLLFTIFVQIIALFLVPVALYMILTKQNIKQTADQFFIKKISLKTILLSLILGILAYILICYVSTFWNTILSLFGYSSSSGGVSSNLPVWLAFVLGIVSTAILPGFGEEMAHRGLLLGNIKTNGYKRAILITALMFGLAHLNIPQFGHAFAVGLILATVTFITRSIFPAMIIHATSNFVSLYLSYASAYGWFMGGVPGAIENFVTGSNIFVSLLVTILVFFVLLFFIIFIIAKLFKEYKLQHFKQFCKNLRKKTEGLPLEEQIDFNNKAQLVSLYNQASALDLEQKIASGQMPAQHLDKELGSNPLNTMLYSKIDEYKPPNKMDNLFMYISIFMMVFITIATFIWGL